MDAMGKKKKEKSKKRSTQQVQQTQQVAPYRCPHCPHCQSNPGPPAFGDLTIREGMDLLKEIGFLDENGQATDKYRDWGDGISRACDQVYLHDLYALK